MWEPAQLAAMAWRYNAIAADLVSGSPHKAVRHPDSTFHIRFDKRPEFSGDFRGAAAHLIRHTTEASAQRRNPYFVLFVRLPS